MSGDRHGLHKDPAIERFYQMRENSHLNFRITRRSGSFLLITFALIPAGLTYLSYKVHIDLAGKRRGESLWR